MASVILASTFDTDFGKPRWGSAHDGRARNYLFATNGEAEGVSPGDTLIVDLRTCDRCRGEGVEPHDPMKQYIVAPPCMACGGLGSEYTVGVATVIHGYDPSRPNARTISTRRPTMTEAAEARDSLVG